VADNQKLFEQLIYSGWLHANRSRVFDEPTPWKAGWISPPMRGLADAALFAAVTHNSWAAISSAVAFTAQLGALLLMERVPSPEWCWKRYVEIASPIEGGASLQMRGGEDIDYNGRSRLMWQPRSGRRLRTDST
jgi:hypothetical protein